MPRSPRDDDEANVRATEEAYDRAWCAGDLDALIGCLASDAVLVNPRGEVAIGENAIRTLGGFLRGEAQGTTHQTIVDRVSFVADDVGRRRRTGGRCASLAWRGSCRRVRARLHRRPREER